VRVLLRADSDAAIGSGHVLRMLALARAVCAAGGEARLASASIDAATARRVAAHDLPLLRCDAAPGSEADLAWTLAQARAGDWLVADGYAFGERWQRAARAAGVPLLVVDDFGHCDAWDAALVLNPNASADAQRYTRRAPDTRLLLGPHWAPLRPEFRDAIAKRPPPRDRATRLLVTLGGSDPARATERVVAALALRRDPALRTRFVIGAANPDAARLAALARDAGAEALEGVEDMAAEMLRADVAVSAAGTTALELCALGVPALLVITADNQVEAARALARAGACELLGWHHEAPAERLRERIDALVAAPARRAELAARGRALVDGRGAERVVEALRGRA
jgi:UDP-2,4-diacetamido-2,4,6-trideoxy-beta-L-altropyranose hydrolase